MVRNSWDLSVEHSGPSLNICNGRIQLRLYKKDGGFVQEFHAIDRTGAYRPVLSSLHKALIPASEHRVTASPMISSRRKHLFELTRESLRMVYSDASVNRDIEGQITVKLSGTVQDHSLNCYITILAGSQFPHIRLEDTISSKGRPPLLEYLMDSYVFLPGSWAIANGKPLDCIWTPILRPEDDQIIGDHTFSSPAVIIRHGHSAAALIPDVRALSQSRPMPAALDFDISNGLLNSPLLSFGFCGYEFTDDRAFSRHDITMSQTVRDPQLTYSYYLYVNADSHNGSAFSDTGRFLWETFGSQAAANYIPREIECTVSQPETIGLRYDTHTGQRPRSITDLINRAQIAFENYKNTKAPANLKNAMSLLDQLCLCQSVWDANWTSHPIPPGALAASNTGWAADPVTTAQFAKLAMDIGDITGDKYYFQRGTAAYNAALRFDNADNESRRQLTECIEYIRRKYGYIYINVSRQWGAFAPEAHVRSLRFEKRGISIDLAPNTNGNGHRRLVFGGLRGKSYTVRINGRDQVFGCEELRSGIKLS